MTAPKFGKHVLFATQGFNLTGQTYRQRVYNLLISPEGRLVIQIHRLKDESWFEKAAQDPSSVVHLDPAADAECIEGCNVFWTFIPEEN